jgi:hypothetical protein
MDPLDDAPTRHERYLAEQLAFLTLSQMPDNRAQMPSHGPRSVRRDTRERQVYFAYRFPALAFWGDQFCECAFLRRVTWSTAGCAEGAVHFRANLAGTHPGTEPEAVVYSYRNHLCGDRNRGS